MSEWDATGTQTDLAGWGGGERLEDPEVKMEV